MDARLVFQGRAWSADMVLSGAVLDTDGGLETAVIVSLFTDRRARPDDVPPGAADDRRGWWADALPPSVDGQPLKDDRIGSRLWLLSREKVTAETVRRARDYCLEALAWLKEVGLARAVEVETEAQGSRLAALITITRPDGQTETVRFDSLWEAQDAL